MKKKNIILIIVILIFFIGIYLLLKPKQPVLDDEELAKCIGSNSELYILLGCTHCENQKQMFGDNYKYLRVIDCFFEQQRCSEKNIRYTPTWIIKGQKYEGVKKIEELKELTGCG